MTYYVPRTLNVTYIAVIDPNFFRNPQNSRRSLNSNYPIPPFTVQKLPLYLPHYNVASLQNSHNPHFWSYFAPSFNKEKPIFATNQDDSILLFCFLNLLQFFPLRKSLIFWVWSLFNLLIRATVPELVCLPTRRCLSDDFWWFYGCETEEVRKCE
jgi:hypothetical protein